MKVIRRIIKSITNNIADKFYLTLVMTILSLSFILSLFIYNYSDNIIHDLKNNIQPIAAIKSIYNDIKYHPSDKKINELADYDSTINTIKTHIQYIEYLNDKYQPIYSSLNAYNNITNNIVGYSDDYGFLYSDIIDNNSFKENTKDFIKSYNPFLNVISLSSERNEIPSKVYYEGAEIIEGRSFTKEELDEAKPVIILPGENLKYQNDTKAIKVGDYVSFSILSNGYNGLELENGNFRNHHTYEFEVIGFINGQSIQNENIVKALIPEKLYMEIIAESAKMIAQDNPNYFFLYSKSSKESDIGQYITANIMNFYPSTIKLKSIEELEMLYQEIAEYNKSNGNVYEIESSLEEYKYLETNFIMLKTIVTYVIIFSFVLAIVIYSLIIISDIRKRNKEIGILMALGENKYNIIIQFIIEYIIIAFISLFLGILISIPLEKMMMNLVFNSYTNDIILNGYLNNNVINEMSININLNIEMILVIFIIEIIIILIAIIPLFLMIYKQKPKKILDGE